MTFKLGVFHLWQANFASYEESTGSLTWGLFYYCTARMYSTDCAVLSAIIKLLNS